MEQARARAHLADTSEEVDSGIRSEEMESGRPDKRFGMAGMAGKLAPLAGSKVQEQASIFESKPIGFVNQIRRQFDVQKVDENADGTAGKGFTVTGSGSMFLKSSANKSQLMAAVVQTEVDKPAGIKSVGTKGILRENLTDVRGRINFPDNLGLDSEEKKIVRFKLIGNDSSEDKETPASRPSLPIRPSNALNKNLTFQYSDGSSGGEEEVVEDFDGDDDDAWTPRPADRAKLITVAKGNESKASINSSEKDNEITTLKAENSKLAEEMNRVKLEHQQKLQQYIADQDMALEEKKREMEIVKQKSLTVFESQLEEKLKNVRHEIEESYRASVESFRNERQHEFEKERDILINEYQGSIELLAREHREEIHTLQSEYANKLAETKSQLIQEYEEDIQKHKPPADDDRVLEKIRCEKRLLEDKYRCLKDKYVRLKTDVKLSLEKRNTRRREQKVHTTSDSNSNKTTEMVAIQPDTQRGERNQQKTVLEEKKIYGDKQFGKFDQNPEDTTSISETTTISLTHNKLNICDPRADKKTDSEALLMKITDSGPNRSRERKKLFGRLKSASMSRLQSSDISDSREEQSCTPVENLRRQLKKLEDLEDQFPDTTLDATYHLRYPFTINHTSNHGSASSELEFFKHRIHLERDAIRRAKENLKMQRDHFRARREVGSGKSIRRKDVDQAIFDDKDLTEMEVKFHRTRALLGEKIIRLRYMEQSLQDLYDKDREKHNNTGFKNDTTLSDISSHSSSGFSSTDYSNQITVPRGHGFSHESTADILKNLETLNADIREIWELLSKQNNDTDNYYSGDLDWSFNVRTPSLPLTQVTSKGSNRNLMSLVSESTLAERTRDLRNWLRQAKEEHFLAQKRSEM